MKNFLPFCMGSIVMFSACQQTEQPSDSTLDAQSAVSISATIENPAVAGRYVQESDAVTAKFSEGDQIGVFMDDAPAVLWSFSKTSWSAEHPMFWPDATQPHAFYAYYPCKAPVATSKDQISMPSLQGQSGRWEDVYKHDFLVASNTLAYTSNHGNVAFSGAEHAFKHVSTLLKIHLVADENLKGATIDQLVLGGGTDLFSQRSYSFATNQATVVLGSSSNSVTIQPKQQVDTQDVTYYFVVNSQDVASQGNTPLDLTIKYTASDGQTHFTARQEGINSQLMPGTSYRFNVQVQGDKVIVSGGDISDWTAGNGEGETVVVNSEEDRQ